MGRIIIFLSWCVFLGILFYEGFHIYMHATWDNQIIIRKTTVYYAIQSRGHGSESYRELRSEQEFKNLAAFYNEPIKIIKKRHAGQEQYYWANNNNRPLIRSTKYINLGKNGQITEDTYVYHIFETENKDVHIEIQGNQYLRYTQESKLMCNPDKMGNVIITYKRESDKRESEDIKRYAATFVYESPRQLSYCYNKLAPRRT